MQNHQLRKKGKLFLIANALQHKKKLGNRTHKDCIIIILAYQALRGRVLGY
jgi:hypothetical protein